MRFECPFSKKAVTAEACLEEQEKWDDGEAAAACRGDACAHFVCDSIYSHRERLLWIYRMETDRQAVERKAPPPAIGA
jgi:hypothetical protein